MVVYLQFGVFWEKDDGSVFVFWEKGSAQVQLPGPHSAHKVPPPLAERPKHILVPKIFQNISENFLQIITRVGETQTHLGAQNISKNISQIIIKVF